MDADLCIKIRVQRGWPTAGGEGELPFNSPLTPDTNVISIWSD